jgi:hypothetical protein
MNIIGVYLVEVEEIVVFFEVFFFLHVHTRGERKIQTSYIRFIRHSYSQLNYLLGTLSVCVYYYVILKIELLMHYGVVGLQKQTTIELQLFLSQYFIKDLRRKG